MSEATGVLPTNPSPMNRASLREQGIELFKHVHALTAPYWKSDEKVFAWSLLTIVVSLNMASIYMMVLLNDWNGSFYNVLQDLDKDRMPGLLLQFFCLVLVYIVIAVSESFLRSYLAFKWRVWLTKSIMHDWLKDNTFCRLFTYKTKTENPDQRISQDISVFTSNSLSLGLDIFTQGIKCITFAVILWNLSSGLVLPLPGGNHLTIPGYMLWLTIIYVTISTYMIYKAGKPLIALDYAQEKVEADFRFGLMRVRERREEVSVLDGSKAEMRFLTQNLIDVIKNYKQIIKRNIYVNSLQNLFLNFTTVLPILAASPMFFSGAITLGVLMQISNAFGQVEGAMMVFALNFQSFAAWKATLNRIVDFRAEMAEISRQQASNDNELKLHKHATAAELKVNNLTVHLPHQKDLAKFDFTIKPHERVLIMGRSGLGKSTLLKCIAGHWPFASGHITRPDHLTIIPQKPYFPISTLRNSLLYPNLDYVVSDTEIKRVLAVCQLPQLQNRLDEVHDWNAILSLGEQQRLNFARIILAKQTWVILDEPTASMDKALETKLFSALFAELPTITVVTIGHALSLKDLHTRCIDLV
jgi:putative ATP-binding cassette transporter